MIRFSFAIIKFLLFSTYQKSTHFYTRFWWIIRACAIYVMQQSFLDATFYWARVCKKYNWVGIVVETETFDGYWAEATELAEAYKDKKQAVALDAFIILELKGRFYMLFDLKEAVQLWWKQPMTVRDHVNAFIIDVRYQIYWAVFQKIYTLKHGEKFEEYLRRAGVRVESPHKTSKRIVGGIKITLWEIYLTFMEFTPHITKVYYNLLKTTGVALIVALFLIYSLIQYYYINFTQQAAIWLVIGLLFLWLISGFNFFLKRYRYGKFTSAVSRFWKRTNSYFWLVEGFLFLLFFYYYLNSSQEPLYMYDFTSLTQDYLISLPNFYINSLLLSFLFLFGNYIMLTLSSRTTRQTFFYLTILSAGLTYIFIIESYQFYYVLNLFNEATWEPDEELNAWVLEFDAPFRRIKHQYMLLALIAKYWHFLFIIISWIFFIFKSFEQKRVHYTLFGVNLQNILILFLLNLLFAIQWIKFVARRFYDTVYYWFFTDPNNNFLEMFILEFYNLVKLF